MELKKEVAAMIDALSQIGSDPTGGMTRLLIPIHGKKRNHL